MLLEKLRMRDLAHVHAVLFELDGQRYRLRTDLTGVAGPAFAAAGVRPPSVVTLLGPLTDPPDCPVAESTAV